MASANHAHSATDDRHTPAGRCAPVSHLKRWSSDSTADRPSILKFELGYLYDLSAAGKYTVYAEVMDPSSHRWLRTQTVNFEMTTAAQ